jgi:hypothetical protein
VILAGLIADRIFVHGATLPDFKVQLGVVGEISRSLSKTTSPDLAGDLARLSLSASRDHSRMG